MSQYQGDVSDSVLVKLSSYYNEHAPLNTPYLIYRSGQNTYVLIYGATSDYTHWVNPTIVTLDNIGTGYNGYNAVSVVTENGDYTLSPISYTGYAYSSNIEWLPSRYITNDRSNTMFLGGLFVAVVLFALSSFISSLICSWRDRKYE